MNATSGCAQNPLAAIRHLDYTVIFARDLQAMRRFYADVMLFRVRRELGEGWVEFQIGTCVLALTRRGVLFDDPPPPEGALSLQLAFRVERDEVDMCANALRAASVRLEKEPTDQPWGHRTLFFRDPDGNVLEIYAEI
jgi:lactoylglutathione lyase